jgi:tRNA (guanine-N7-)-methyltransferase
LARCKTAVETGLHNVALFVPKSINQPYFCGERSRRNLDHFSDPQIKYKRTKHRMTNSNFYSCKKILKRRCSEFKTDSEFMHGYTLGLLHGEGHEVLYANQCMLMKES